jgi:hypothetical protein
MGSITYRGARMAVMKKGFLFTAIAIILVAGIVLLAATHDRTYPRTLAQTNQIASMNMYLQSIQRDLPSVVYISSFRGLIGMEEYISGTGEYLPDFDTAFTSIIINGTVNGTYYAIMDDSTFTDFSQRLNGISKEQGLTVNLTALSANATQTSPWLVMVNVTIHIEITNADNTVSFNRTENVSALVPIDGIKDPLYTVSTNGRAPHPVTRSTVSRPYITPSNDTTGLQMLINQTFYIESVTAPSFLQRFKGDLGPSPYGIESLVNIAELRAQELPISTCSSIVDYLYFAGNSTAPNYYIINMDQNNVWLDTAHLAPYDATFHTVGVRPCP